MLGGIFLLWVGFIYFVTVAEPVLRGQSSVNGVLADSIGYHAFAEEESFESMVTKTLGALRAGDYDFLNLHFGLFGVSFVAWVVGKVFGNQYEMVIFVINYILVVSAVKNYSGVFYRLQRRYYRYFMVLLLCNPALYPNLGSLNKEIFGIFFVSSFLKNMFMKRYFRFLVVAVTSLIFRDAYFYVAILFFFMNRFSIKSVIPLIGISLVAPVVLSNLTYHVAADLGARSEFLFSPMLEIEKYPMGYLVTYMPKLAIQFFTGMYPARLADMAIKDPYGTSQTLSSMAFFACFLALGYRMLTKKYVPELIVLRLFFAYTFIFCLTPYSVHRMFIPLYPVVIMMALLGTTRKLAKCSKRYVFATS